MILKNALIALALGVIVFGDKLYQTYINSNKIMVKTNVINEECYGLETTDQDANVTITLEDNTYVIDSNESLSDADKSIIKACLLKEETQFVYENKRIDNGLIGMFTLIFFGLLSYSSLIAQENIIDLKSDVSKMLLAKVSQRYLLASNLIYGWICSLLDCVIMLTFSFVWITIRYNIYNESIIVNELEYNSSNQLMIECFLVVVAGVMIFQIFQSLLCSKAENQSEASVALIIPLSLRMLSYFVATNMPLEWNMKYGIYIPFVNISSIPVILNTINDIGDIKIAMLLYITFELLLLIISIYLMSKQKHK